MKKEVPMPEPTDRSDHFFYTQEALASVTGNQEPVFQSVTPYGTMSAYNYSILKR